MEQQIIREKEVIKIVGKSRTTIWRDEKEGRFPKRVKLGVRAVGWLKSDLEAWLQSLKASAPAPSDPEGVGDGH